MTRAEVWAAAVVAIVAGVVLTALAAYLALRTERSVCDQQHTAWHTVWRDGKPYPYPVEVCDVSHRECWDGNEWGACSEAYP